MNRHKGFLGLLSCLVFAGAVHAQSIELPVPNWHREQALLEAASATPDVTSLLSRAATGEAATLLDSLHALADDPQLKAPAREAALLNFALGLQTLPGGLVDPAVTQWLKGWSAQTLVPHHDYPEIGVPLYHVAAAAAGAEHAWQRETASFEGALLLHEQPQVLVAAFEESDDANLRRGYLQALDAAEFNDIRDVLIASLSRLPQAPVLTELAGRAALITGDLDGLHQAVLHGGGAGLTQILRLAGQTLIPADAEWLLQSLLSAAPPATAALAMGELATLPDGRPRFEALLLTQLANADTGSAAALLLARSEDAGTWREIESLAAGDSPAKRSAALAIQLSGRINLPADAP